jgi:predicted Zn-dependent protease
MALRPLGRRALPLPHSKPRNATRSASRSIRGEPDMQRASLSRTAILLAAASLSFAGCLTSARIAKLGDEAAEQIDQSMGLLPDAELVGYVRKIGSRLAAVSDRPEGPWRFEIANAPEPNAFALPGGHVYVTRGLLALVNSEDELAGVVGHEIAHVTARHSAKRINASLVTAPVTIATGIVGLATSIVSPTIGQAVAGSGQVLTRGVVLAPYSRSQENEADRIGQELAARAGYDPAALARFLETLDRQTQLLYGGERGFSFLADHPLTPERVAKTAERAGKVERGSGGPIASPTQLLDRIDGIVLGHDPAQGIFRENLFLHPELDFSLAMPVGWETANTNAAAAGVAPGEEALVVLRLAATDTSLENLIAEAQSERPDVGFERFEVEGVPAARAELSQRNRYISVTWLGYGGDIFEIIGQCRAASSGQYAPAFDATARSFRALSNSQRASIHELRLRIREARAGETAERIAERVGSAWKPDEIAVANAVELGAAFQLGASVKVAIREPYSPRAK